MARDYSETGLRIEIRIGQWEEVAYAVWDVFGQRIYVTRERLQHIREKRRWRGQATMIKYIDRLPLVLQCPDVVIVDPQYPDGQTHIFYKYVESLTDEYGREAWLAVVVEITGKVNFVWTMHPRRKGKIKTISGMETTVIYQKEQTNGTNAEG